MEGSDGGIKYCEVFLPAQFIWRMKKTQG